MTNHEMTMDTMGISTSKRKSHEAFLLDMMGILYQDLA